ncbi:hypothetical protein BUALT_Bualt04G0118900 [Buddleja alternifolia]|uniref:Reticulon-like protein n=1 Tax=Buddleja alternifolia TaxID=168488 RepID=A0AAV6XQC8_9LAMI|nr:hypothetical protein BUALT_Bualt04G0118900 [Buddleja alternifolia]
MSDTLESESPPVSPPESPPSPVTSPKAQLQAESDLLKDLMLWRRKQLNVLLLVGATASFIVMQIYQYNFITLFSWLAMALVVCFFFWGNIHRLLKKESPDLSELEIREETAMNTATLSRQRVEDAIRMMFHVSAESEWFVFAGVVTFLYLLSMVATYLDLLTLCYIGVMGGMTMPVTYIKNEDKLRELGRKLRMKSQSMYSMIEERLLKIKNKVVAGKHEEIKEKKRE